MAEAKIKYCFFLEISRDGRFSIDEMVNLHEYWDRLWREWTNSKRVFSDIEDTLTGRFYYPFKKKAQT